MERSETIMVELAYHTLKERVQLVEKLLAQSALLGFQQGSHYLVISEKKVQWQAEQGCYLLTFRLAFAQNEPELGKIEQEWGEKIEGCLDLTQPQIQCLLTQYSQDLVV